MSEKGNVLVVDAGNTRVKWTAFIDDLIVWNVSDLHLQSSPSVENRYESFAPDRIYFASVRKSIDNQLLIAHLIDVYGRDVDFYELFYL